jgi:CRISPR-associated protein Csm3
MPASLSQKPLLGKFRLTSTLCVETGLHIGGGGENLDIGGLDKPVIRDPLTQFPYLPGSSIKGKLRSILERIENKPLNRPGGSGTYRYESDDLEDGFSEVSGQQIPFQGARICPVSRVFGSTGTTCWLPFAIVTSQGLEHDKNAPRKQINEIDHIKVRGRNAPARLIVRDCHLVEASAEQLKKVDTGLYMTEWKFENGIDRITAAANPRQLERVPKGSEFAFELIYTVEDAEQAQEDLKNLAIALAILEDDALGGHGSRGYGKVRFQNFQFSYRNVQQYRQMTTGEAPTASLVIEDTTQLLTRFSTIQNLLPGSSS